MNKAFTLIELLVTVAIIVLLLAVAIPSFNNYGRYNELYQIAQTIKSDILQTENMALSPSKDKKISGADIYKIIFSQDSNYAIYEELSNSDPSKVQEELVLQGGIGIDYPIKNINPATQVLPIKFSISQHGKIVDPVIDNDIHIQVVSNRISSQDNFVDIYINSQTGQINLVPAWKK